VDDAKTSLIGLTDSIESIGQKENETEDYNWRVFTILCPREGYGLHVHCFEFDEDGDTKKQSRWASEWISEIPAHVQMPDELPKVEWESMKLRGDSSRRGAPWPPQRYRRQATMMMFVDLWKRGVLTQDGARGFTPNHMRVICPGCNGDGSYDAKFHLSTDKMSTKDLTQELRRSYPEDRYIKEIAKRLESAMNYIGDMESTIEGEIEWERDELDREIEFLKEKIAAQQEKIEELS